MIAYLDLPSGISGDMFLGCLLDAGFPLDALRQTIAALKLPPDEYAIDAHILMKGPLRATLADIQTSEAHAHRHLADITAIITAADLPPRVKENAIAVFARLAAAEAKVHNTTPDKIHFHEVGAMDAIIDIVGACAGIHHLGITKLHASPLPLSPGWTNSQHGLIPLPAPATLELLAAAGAPTRPGPANNTPGEWVTPTGAALVCQLATFSQPPMTLQKIGTGAGRKNTPWPNIARLWLGTPATSPANDFVQLETNIDDMNPQLYSAVSDKLFAAGAKDVWFTPIHMKKNRPAILLSALAPASLETPLANVMLEETTTLGVRVHSAHRHEAAREFTTLDTPHGPLRAKIKFLADRPIAITPEYDDLAALAQKLNLPLKQLHDTALAAAHALLTSLQNNP